ncbi:MAG TPA: DUF6516 family protein [bacterium]
MFYSVIEEYSDIITTYSVSDFRKYGSATSLVAQVNLIDGSELHIKDYLFLDGKRKYSYHWQDANGNLISRWDNSPHHQEISTFPHHRHLPDATIDSQQRNIRDIFKIITEIISKNEQ